MKFIRYYEDFYNIDRVHSIKVTKGDNGLYRLELLFAETMFPQHTSKTEHIFIDLHFNSETIRTKFVEALNYFLSTDHYNVFFVNDVVSKLLKETQNRSDTNVYNS